MVNNDDSGQAEDAPARDALGLPFTTLGYGNGPGYHGASDLQPAGPKSLPHFPPTVRPHPAGRADLTDVDVEDSLFLQESAIPMAIETHAGEDVAVYARGPGADGLGAVIEQSVVYYLMESALGDVLKPAQP